VSFEGVNYSVPVCLGLGLRGAEGRGPVVSRVLKRRYGTIGDLGYILVTYIVLGGEAELWCFVGLGNDLQVPCRTPLQPIKGSHRY